MVTKAKTAAKEPETVYVEPGELKWLRNCPCCGYEKLRIKVKRSYGPWRPHNRSWTVKWVGYDCENRKCRAIILDERERKKK